MTLNHALTLVDNIHAARSNLDVYLKDTLQEYINFQIELGSGHAPARFTNAEEYHFTEIDGSYFNFISTENFYEYGETTHDEIEMPFSFVDDPEAYKENIRESNRLAAEKRAAKNREAAEKRLADLKRRIVLEEAALNR